jgi:hypothetical protein
MNENSHSICFFSIRSCNLSSIGPNACFPYFEIRLKTKVVAYEMKRPSIIPASSKDIALATNI